MPSTAARKTHRTEGPHSGRIGRLAVVVMVGLGGVLALFGILYQRSQTLRCLRFLGPSAAQRVTQAGFVELLQLRPGDRDGRLVAAQRWDISTARGLVHLRRGLVEDANYDWGRHHGSSDAVDAGGGRLPSKDWEWAIAFAESPSALGVGASTILAFAVQGTDRSEPGWMTVVGAPGRVGLGRIEKGLATWIEAVMSPDGERGRQIWEESARRAGPGLAAP